MIYFYEQLVWIHDESDMAYLLFFNKTISSNV